MFVCSLAKMRTVSRPPKGIEMKPYICVATQNTCRESKEKCALNLWPLWCDSFEKGVHAHTEHIYNQICIIIWPLSVKCNVTRTHRAFPPFPRSCRVVISQKIMTPFFFSFSTQQSRLFIRSMWYSDTHSTQTLVLMVISLTSRLRFTTCIWQLVNEH